MIGETVSHYRIRERIGAGGMGTVYLATDTKLHRRVALKFLPDDLTRDPEWRHRFVREARAAGAIDHPNIAAIHDIEESDGRTFIVMEYVEGQSLRSLLEEGRLDLDATLALVLPVASALAKAHDHGVVHRDVKPENILVASDGYPKLVDFGLAKLVDAGPPADEESETAYRTARGQVFGTAAYMSPEQARGEAVDARSDIFSLGVVVYEMLSGKSPFRRGTAIESMHAVLKDQPPPLPHADADRAVGKALAKDAGDRFENMVSFTAALASLKDETAPSRPQRWWPAAFATAIAGLALVVGLWALWEPEPQPGVGASGRPSIAILYFENNSGDEEIRWLSQGLPSMLLTDLAQTPGLDVVSSQRVAEILRQVGSDDLERIEKNVAAEVARRSGAGAVIVGAIFKAGDEIRIDVQVEDVGTGRVLSAESVRGTEVFTMVDELSGRIREGLRFSETGADRPLADISTHSIEAYRLFIEALDAARHVREADARRLYEEAVRRDPGFAMAHYELSRILTMWDVALADEHKQKALDNLERLSARERLVVESGYALVEDPVRAIELAEKLVATYPDDERGYPILHRAHRALGEVDLGIAAMRAGVAANPASGYLQALLGYALLQVGRFDEALEAFEEYESLDPEEANPLDSQGEVYLLMGRPEEAVERFDRALEIDPMFNAARFARLWANAMRGHYGEALEDVRRFIDQATREGFPTQHLQILDASVVSRAGRYEQAARAIEMGARLADERSDVAVRVELFLLDAWLSLERGRYDAAVSLAVRAADDAPITADADATRSRYSVLLGHLLAGIAEARRDDVEAAKRHHAKVAELAELEHAMDVFIVHTLEGEIALASGDPEGAKMSFLAGEPSAPIYFDRRSLVRSIFASNLPLRDGLARAERALDNEAAAIEAYRRLLEPERNPNWQSWLEPRYVLALARTLDDAGDTNAARVEYERFLELWRDADEGLPEVAEARTFLE